MNKKYIKDIIKEDYKNWNTGDLVFILAGTGRGKTYFMKHEFNTYCKENNKQVLYLTNRINLQEQIKNDLGQDNTNITVKNYQKVEKFILNGTLDLNNYDYIVCDECHYFFSDARFNIKTDLSFKKILENKNVCKIMMTATAKTILYYFEHNNIEINYKYKLKTDYSYLDKITCFNDYESVDSIIEDIPQNEQIIFFSSAKRALEVAQKYKGTFICSQGNKDGLWNKHIAPKKVKNENGEEEEIPTENYLELRRIIETGTFNNHLLCCTTVLDNGINIKEGTPVKHIILDILDRDEFIQCLGRKRVLEGEKINLYFYSYNDKRRINGFRTKVVNSLERADYLKENGENEYVKMKFKTDIYDSKIIDDINGVDGQIHKIVNECMYMKSHVDKITYDCLLDKKYSITLKDIIALSLGIKKDVIIDMKTTIIKYSLEEAFEKTIGKKLYKNDRKELIEFVGLKDSRGRLQKSIGQLNEYLKANNFPYIIISKRIKENNKLKTVWIIENLIIKK
ncbi:DEAD/DEAH box helicase family protein [Haloimpatiens massiliensis]|uniref:DEAD/DEAH box helicase family protein n=1 Tax=Haloimpatiens massiliensis TaxID=1658110 RepID=UPI000C846A6E|nr:DEAD/DEAH box helicase family protein [Haloimpatiens massiliensis]